MHYVLIEGSLNRELSNKNIFSIVMEQKPSLHSMYIKKAFLTAFLLKQCWMAREKK